MQPIAHIESCFPTKFGIPRQAGIVDTPARIVFEPPYRIADALRGLEDFDYIWLIWFFSQSEGHNWSPTVRPPRLGGNRRMGVFATRSPFRPNPIGLSSVRLLSIETDPQLGPVLNISGADLMDGTPILDIKPYLPYTDSHPQARSGFAPTAADTLLHVEYNPETKTILPPSLFDSLTDLLAHDPRPQYQSDPNRVYGMGFAGYEIKFTVSDGIVTVIEITPKA
ncbi:MAG: tRNA (N6-threonylcarbamoyladenosine(37)-N6)-methyltransferase TrmO [Bacteroidales bacterium]|nr:tRNA (N6-threonylcarbamoyladenosine(37)-N6)-methyltransferase TrmO [Bacteroidales bacterium]